MDLVLVEQTRLIMVTWWDSAVTTFFSLFNTAASGAAGRKIVRLEGCRVSNVPSSDWNGSSFSDMTIVHSVYGDAQGSGIRC